MDQSLESKHVQYINSISNIFFDPFMRESPVECSNCNSQDKPAKKYHLTLDNRDGSQTDLAIHFCQDCFDTIVEFDWVTHQKTAVCDGS